MMQIRVEGLDEAIAKMEQLAKEIPQQVDRLIEDAAEKIFGDSQREVPVDTGTLQRSGSHNHEFLKSEVGYNTPYAEFVHDGTSKQRAQPYLRAPAERELPRINQDMEKIRQG